MPPNGFTNNAINLIMANEGGYSNIALDRGGPTKWGITMDDLREWLKRPITVQDVQNITPEQAHEFYWEFYLKPLMLDKLNSYPVVACLADCSVLYGEPTIVRITQTILKGYGYNLMVDGKMGDITVVTLNKMNPVKFVPDFHAQILNRITEIVTNDPSQEIFAKGWTDRADRLLTLV